MVSICDSPDASVVHTCVRSQRALVRVHAHFHASSRTNAGRSRHKRVSPRGCGLHRDNSRALAVTTHRSRSFSHSCTLRYSLYLSLEALERPPRWRRLTVAPFTYGNAHRLTRDGLVLIGLGGAHASDEGQLIGKTPPSLSIASAQADVIDDDTTVAPCVCVSRLGYLCACRTRGIRQEVR